MSLDRKFHSYQQVVGTNAIPLAMDKQIITKQHSPAISNVTLTVTDTKSDKQLALKPIVNLLIQAKKNYSNLLLMQMPSKRCLKILSHM